MLSSMMLSSTAPHSSLLTFHFAKGVHMKKTITHNTDRSDHSAPIDDNQNHVGLGVSAHASMESGAHGERLTRFHGHQGHGFAAEQVNDLLDKAHGRKAAILGDDNAKNGADRMVDGRLIQTKYCQTAKASIEAGFRNGQYRYVDGKGQPMQLEVPSDQYEEAVKIMREKIAGGHVPGVTDPREAESLVRRGQVDYRTACRIAKAGTVESLLFDAAHGAMIGTSAFGISAAIVFAKAIWDGKPVETALDEALRAGISSGGTAFLASVVTDQVARTGLAQMLMKPSIELVKAMPPSVRQALVNLFRNGPSIYGAAATKNLAKLLRTNLVAQAAMTLVLSADSIASFVRGRISGPQLFKEVTSVAGGLEGGVLGGALAAWAIGASGGLLAKVAIAVGTVAGGALGGRLTRSAVGTFVEDDAVKLVAIVNDRLTRLAQEYLLSEEELSLVTEDLRKQLVKDQLLAMYAAKDREAFADALLTRSIEGVIRFRARISMPTEAEAAERIPALLEGLEKGNPTVSSETPDVDPKALGEALLGRPVEAEAAGKAWYVTKQRQAAGAMAEYRLQSMKGAEERYSAGKKRQDIALDSQRAAFDRLVKGDHHGE